MTKLQYEICEACNNGEIDIDTRNMMLDVYNESVLSPLRKYVEKMKEIKQCKPKEYDGPEDVKKFIDKNYDDVVKIARILEKEPEDLKKGEFRNSIVLLITIVGGYATLVAGAGTGVVAIGITGAVTMILGFIYSTVMGIINYIRVNNDIKVSDDLNKVKAALGKIKKDKLPKDAQNKIADMIEAINDAETEMSARIKVQKESVDDLKMEIYERELNGEITAEERELLINYMESKTE